MDKKSIIGLVLIFGIFVGYMWWVSPTEEERAEMQARHDSMVAAYQDSLIKDSIAQAEVAALRQHVRDSILAVNPDAVIDDEAANGIVTIAEKTQKLGVFAGNVAVKTDTLNVKNKVFDVSLTNLGAAVNKVVLADYLTYDSLPLLLISPSEENMNLVFSTNDNRVINTKDLHFETFVNGEKVSGGKNLNVEKDSLVVAYRAYAQENNVNDTNAQKSTDKSKYLEFLYTFYPNSYEVGFHINFHGLSKIIRADEFMDFEWQNRMNRQEKVDPTKKGTKNPNKDPEFYHTNVYYKPANDKVEDLGRKDAKVVKTPVDWVAFKQQFFCAILTGDKPFENADLSTKTLKEDTASNYLCNMYSTIGLSYNSEKDCSMDLQYYFGPSKYRDLKAMDKGFERMLPLGWGFFLIQWTSRLLITCFNFLEQFHLNYGIIIIIITLLLRTALLPLVWNSYKTGAISRILRPEMDALNKKYPNQEQAMQKQQEMMRLQKAAGINPMMGCLPMLIQLPILWAMFRFYPASIELRQQHFLWCDDLSTYDSVLNLGFSIPLGYGDHVSLFCLIMFAVQFFYTWYTMRNQPANANMPGMKFMMYFMPVMMLFIFNSQSAALNLYYAVSLIFTMITMMLIRKFTSEKKVRARMAAYQLKQQKSGKKGNGKKSKWQQRLEEMQKMAEQAQKEQQRRK